MTNPNNAIGTNGAYGGRTSVNAFNDDLAFYTRGVVSGWSASPNSGMTIQLGGVAGYRDVAVAQDNAGNNTSINNISGNPVEVTIDTAPSTNSRIDVVVAYVDNPPQGDSSTVDNPGSCGIIAVKGTASSSPSVPNDSAIRTAITGDGVSGATAYYVILAKVTVGTNVTVISAGAISSGDIATMDGSHIAANSINASQLNFATLNFGNYSLNEQNTGFTWVDGKSIYKKTINTGQLPNNTFKNVSHDISNLDTVICFEGFAWSTGQITPLPFTASSPYLIEVSANSTSVQIYTFTDKSSFTSSYLTIYYTKN